jgi:CRISPR-associated protein Cas6
MANKNLPDMIDLMFDLDGGNLPAAYRFALWTALLRLVPHLAEEKLVGVLPLRSTVNGQGMLLAKRAKLVMRMPTTLAGSAASSLTGQQLDIAGNKLRLGTAKTRTIQPYPTIQETDGGIGRHRKTDLRQAPLRQWRRRPHPWL